MSYYGQQQAYPPQQYGQPYPQQQGSFPPMTGSNHLVDIFRQWDKNGDGTINEYELAQILASMGEDSSPEVVKAIIGLYDKDGNGVIDFNEFQDLYNYVQEMHKEFSQGAAGEYITYDQAQSVLSRGFHGPAMVAAPALLYSVWKIYDTHNTGKMNWKHFFLLALALKGMQKGYTPSHKNGGLMGKIMNKVETMIQGHKPAQQPYGQHYGTPY